MGRLRAGLSLVAAGLLGAAAPHPSRSCRELLASSPKATLQWQQEARFTVFEHQYSRSQP